MGAYPSADHPSSGYLLQHDGWTMMLDLGSGVLMKLREYIDINELSAVFFSHYHPDHVADTGVLQHAVKVQTDLGIRTSVLKFFGLPGKTFFDSLNYHSYTEATAIDPGSEMMIGPLSFRFLLNPHPDGGCSVRIEGGGRSIVYTGDTGWNDELPGFASGCDLLLCECSLFNRFKGRVEGHLTAGETGRIAEAAGAGQLALCHFPHFGVREELLQEASEEFQGQISLALPGRVYDLT